MAIQRGDQAMSIERNKSGEPVIVCFGMIITAAVLLAVSWSPARALTICVTDGSVICFSATPEQAQIARDARMIETGQHQATGSYVHVDELKRTKETWPLGKPSLQNCRFCLQPDRLNVERLKSLP